MNQENTRYLARRMLRKILLPTTLSTLAGIAGVVVADNSIVALTCGQNGLIIAAVFYPFLLLWVAAGCVFEDGGTVLFSIAKGAGEPQKAQKIFAGAVTTGVLTFAVFASLFCLLLPQIVEFYQFDREMSVAAIYYGMWITLGISLDSLSSILYGFVNSDSSPRLAMAGIFIQIGTYLGMDVLFMVVLRTGVVGAAYAYVVASTLSSAFFIGYFLFGRTALRLRPQLMSFAMLKSCVKYSYTAVAHNAGLALTGIVLNRILSIVFGAAAIAIFAVLAMTESITSAIFRGIAKSSGLIIGVFAGENNPFGMIFTFRQVLKTGIITAGILSLLLLMFPGGIFMLFQMGLEQECNNAIRLFALSLIPTFLNWNTILFYQTTGHSKLAFILALLQGVVIKFIVGVALCFYREIEFFWLTYLITELLMFGIIAVAVSMVKRTGRYASWYLLREPQINEPVIFSELLDMRTFRLENVLANTGAVLDGNPQQAEIQSKLRELLSHAASNIRNSKCKIVLELTENSKQDIAVSLFYEEKKRGGKSTSSSDEIYGFRHLQYKYSQNK